MVGRFSFCIWLIVNGSNGFLAVCIVFGVSLLDTAANTLSSVTVMLSSLTVSLSTLPYNVV